MGVPLPLLPLPRPSKSAPSSPKNSPLISQDLFSLPTTLTESEHSLRTLFRSNDDDEHKSKPINPITFHHHNDDDDDDDDKTTPMAFAEDLFLNGMIVPLRPPSSLKLPPRLTSPRSTVAASSSPKSAGKVRGLKGWKEFDPFMAALERIRKEDASVEPFHWRQLERSYKESFGRVFGDAWGETSSGWDFVGGGGDGGEWNAGRRSGSFYCRLEMEERRCCCKTGAGGSWRLLSCFLRKK